MERAGHKIFSAVLAFLLLAATVYAGYQAVVYAAAYTAAGRAEAGAEDRKRCVVIDAGHGGDDPGKVGINGAKEKDINLQVAEQVKRFLEANDIQVIMTRESDEGL